MSHAYTIHGLVVVSVGEGAVRAVALAAVLLALLGQDVVVVLLVLVLDVEVVMVVLSLFQYQDKTTITRTTSRINTLRTTTTSCPNNARSTAASAITRTAPSPTHTAVSPCTIYACDSRS